MVQARVVVVALSLPACGASEPPKQPEPIAVPTLVAGGSLPAPVTAQPRWKQVAASSHTCAVTVGGALYCWGGNVAGEVAPPGVPQVVSPRRVGTRSDWQAVAVGLSSLGLAADGTVHVWGFDGPVKRPGPTPVVITEGRAVAIAAGYDEACVLTRPDDMLRCWHIDPRNRDAGMARDDAVVDGHGPDKQSLSVGTNVCFIMGSGALFCQGLNDYGNLAQGHLLEGGQQGDACTRGLSYPTEHDGGPPEGRITPVCQISHGTKWRSIAAGEVHLCGITIADELYCWGDNAESQVGPQDSRVTRPLRVGRDHAWQSVAVGRSHSCAVTTGGDLYCWGSNEHGQLGLGNGVSAQEPTRVKLDAPCVQIAAGSDHTCAITGDGDLYCWGLNRGGRLGIGTTEPSDRPQRVVLR